MIMKTVFFFDLDNTIYFTEPNKEVLMSGLYNKLDQEDLGLSENQYAQAKEDMMRIPFLKVAEHYHFPSEVTNRIVEYLSDREVTETLSTCNDYHHVKNLQGSKFIITAGFPKQQLSKIKMLGVAADFEDVNVVDVSVTNKKQVFQELIEKHGFMKDEILVVGDDPESEIKFGLELGLDTFLIDPDDRFPKADTTFRGADFSDLALAAGQADKMEATE